MTRRVGGATYSRGVILLMYFYLHNVKDICKVIDELQHQLLCVILKTLPLSIDNEGTSNGCRRHLQQISVY